MENYDAKDYIIKADNHYYNAVHLYKTYVENYFPHHKYDPLVNITNSCALAGEIYIKAYMNETGIEYEYNHKMIKHLNDCIKQNKSFEHIKKDIDLLVNYTSDMNYPNEVKIDKSIARKTIKAVENIIRFQEIKNLREKYGIEDVVLFLETEGLAAIKAE